MGKLAPAYLGSSSGRRLCLSPTPHGEILKCGKEIQSVKGSKMTKTCLSNSQHSLLWQRHSGRSGLSFLDTSFCLTP